MARRARAAAHVIVLTHTADADVPERVADAVCARGADCTRLDTDLLPRAASLSIAQSAAATRVWWRAAAQELDLARASAVWCRRLWPAPALAGPAPLLDSWSRTQARDALWGALATLGAPPLSVRIVNDPHAQARAEHKPLQLAAAARAGLRVPPTLITNDPADARAFIAAQRAAGARVVTKLLAPLSQSMDGGTARVPTSVLDDDDIRALDSLAAAPQIFQSALDKHADVRVVFAGPRAFAGALEARPGDPLDWREGARRRWDAIAVPRAVARAAAALLRALSLELGVLDFVVDRAGRWWFLEVNPAGEWGFLADDLDAPIAAAIARQLAP